MGGGWERIEENEMGATGRGLVRNMWGMERILWIESSALLTNASLEDLPLSLVSERERRRLTRSREFECRGCLL